MSLYHQELIDHYHNPRHKGVLNEPTFCSELYNPSCGDAIAWQGIYQHETIQSLKFQGKGCVISQAAASMLAEKSVGLTKQEIFIFDSKTMLTLLGIELGPTRLKCALLSLEALHNGLKRNSCSITQNY